MKIAYASMAEQQEEIEDLLDALRCDILPMYLTVEELDAYVEMGLLQFNDHNTQYNGTLREAYQLMTALHTLITIIGLVNRCTEQELGQYRNLYDRNVHIINQFGLFFPIVMDRFRMQEDEHESEMLFLSPTNRILA